MLDDHWCYDFHNVTLIYTHMYANFKLMLHCYPSNLRRARRNFLQGIHVFSDITKEEWTICQFKMPRKQWHISMLKFSWQRNSAHGILEVFMHHIDYSIMSLISYSNYLTLEADYRLIFFQGWLSHKSQHIYYLSFCSVAFSTYHSTLQLQRLTLWTTLWGPCYFVCSYCGRY